MKNLKYKRGFTLIELLVVIGIIGILSTVVLASLNNVRIKAENSKTISTLREMQKAILIEEANIGSWSSDTGPGVGCEPCRVGGTPPRFVNSGYYNISGYINPKWNGENVCFDYQNWLLSANPATRFISVDVYQNTSTCGTLIPLRICVFDPDNLCITDLK